MSRSIPGFDHEGNGPVGRKIGARKLLIHIGLLLVTFLTATVAGVLYPFGPSVPFEPVNLPAWDDTWLLIGNAPRLYSMFVVSVVYYLFSYPALLIYGLSFSLPLIFILISHEMGHYIACRIYKVDATLPYFIPTPPMIGPAGTFGAFIKIRSRIPSRRAVFDIGVAGPLAGFAALLPFAFVGVWNMDMLPAGTEIPPETIVFSDPLLLQGIGLLFGKQLEMGTGNPFYFAAWMGLLVTALNLIPSGQLDGGHALYAALGERLHFWTGRLAFAVMATLSIAGFYFFNSPSGFLIAILLGVMMHIPHPHPWDTTPLDLKRKLIAVFTLIVFVLSFVPFPLKIT